MMRIFKFLILVVLLSVQSSNGQSIVNYRSPVDFDIVMAGNLGEIRANHFHSGIDIKALSGVGSPIFAVADGYVSRIGVAPNGYGNFLMITHNNGTQSLYAHLDDFAKPYRDYIRSEQMAVKSYVIDKYISSGKFIVKAGDRIATLGNSGSSAGPHLHFEIRDGRTSEALNPLKIAGYHVGDNIAPVVHKVYVYEQDTILFGVKHFSLVQTIEYKPNRQGVREPSDSYIRVCRPFYLAYELIDYKNGRSNTMGIAALTQMVDSVVNFSFSIDKISFATTRYVNSFVQYDKNRASKFHVLRAYKSDNNKLDVYSNVLQQGIIEPPKMLKESRLSMIVADEKGNTAKINLRVVYDSKRALTTAKFKPALTDRPVMWDAPFVYEDSVMRVRFSPETLYDSEFIPIYSQAGKFVVGNRDTPLNKDIDISIKAGKLESEVNGAKMLLVSLSNDGKMSAVGGLWENGILSAKTKNLGTFTVAIDTVAPTIRPLQKAGALSSSQLRFKITDDLAGVAKYSVFVDGEWTLAEYDPKNALVAVDVLKAKLPKSHSVVVEVKDYKNNVKTLKEKYIW